MEAEMVSESIPDNMELNDDDPDIEMEENEQEEDDVGSEEYVALNDKIDELNDALDSIEKKNDDIHAQLLELLKCSKQFRQEIKERISDNNETATN